MEVRTTDGDALFVDRTRGERGSKGPFYRVYRSADREAAYGYYCSNCESIDNAMDTMGRIVCNGCGNTRRPDVWDAAHE